MSEKKAEKHIATRGVGWKTEKGEVNREAGDDVSDAPEKVLRRLTKIGAVQAADEWKAAQKAAKEDSDGDSR